MKAYAASLLLFLGLEVWAPAPAQTQSQGIPVDLHFPATTIYTMRVIKGKPYSAKQVNEHTQTLADGTHITSPVRSVMMYRDSAGRTRTERPMGPPSVADQYPIVEIRDPVAQVQYTLDPVNKVAHRVAMQAPPRRDGTGVTLGPAAAPAAKPANEPQVQVEDLGSQVMEGLAVRGTKWTTTIPVGVQGNDRPITTVSERWMARDFDLFVLIHALDPRNGETTTKLTDVSTAEPDGWLFSPPTDYSVVDETGPFEIKFVALPNAWPHCLGSRDPRSRNRHHYSGVHDLCIHCVSRTARSRA